MFLLPSIIFSKISLTGSYRLFSAYTSMYLKMTGKSFFFRKTNTHTRRGYEQQIFGTDTICNAFPRWLPNRLFKFSPLLNYYWTRSSSLLRYLLVIFLTDYFLFLSKNICTMYIEPNFVIMSNLVSRMWQKMESGTFLANLLSLKISHYN